MENENEQNDINSTNENDVNTIPNNSLPIQPPTIPTPQGFNPTPEVGQELDPKSRVNKLLKIIMYLLFISAYAISIPAVLYVLWLIYQAHNGVPGTEYGILIFRPVYSALPYISIAGGVSGVLLGVLVYRKFKRITFVILGLILFIYPSWYFFAAHQMNEWMDEYKRVMTADEVIDLIKGCELSVVIKYADTGDVGVEYADNYDENGEYIGGRPEHADSEHFDEYVDAVMRYGQSCPNRMDYYDNSGSSAVGSNIPEGYTYGRWATLEEASDLLENCEIDGLYGSSSEAPNYEEGDYTGIYFSNNGHSKSLKVYDDQNISNGLVTIAENAKDMCGQDRPYIETDSSAEYSKPSSYWMSLSEATSLLKDCEIDVLSGYSYEEVPDVEGAGDYTGIMFSNLGGVKYLDVFDNNLMKDLTEIIENARDACGQDKPFTGTL